MKKDNKVLVSGMRDAIHVPFVIVSCDSALKPGDKCSLRDDNICVKWGGKPEGATDDDGALEVEPGWHGVADPFRESDIPAGELFAIYIRKECFSGLTHDFVIEVHDRGGTSTATVFAIFFNEAGAP